jgi:hypothetical protein
MVPASGLWIAATWRSGCRCCRCCRSTGCAGWSLPSETSRSPPGPTWATTAPWSWQMVLPFMSIRPWPTPRPFALPWCSARPTWWLMPICWSVSPSGPYGGRRSPPSMDGLLLDVTVVTALSDGTPRWFLHGFLT